MTAAQIVVDTNVVSYLFRNGSLGFEYRYLISGQPAGITVLTLEELYYGADCAGWGERKRRQLEEFLADFLVVATRPEIARVCGYIRAVRGRLGRPIDLPDAWLAATALWYQIPVVTHDRDLEGIPGLDVVT